MANNIEFVPSTTKQKWYHKYTTAQVRPPGYYWWDSSGESCYGPYESALEATDGLDGWYRNIE